MRSTSRLAAIGLAGAWVLAACGGDDHGGGQPPPTSGTTTRGFEPYLQQEVQQDSCETTLPVSTTGVGFVFAADQDTAEPRDLSKVTSGCKQ